MIRINKKLFITLSLTTLIIFGALASLPPEPPKAKNLKVLSKKLTHKQLDHIMDGWAHALGVKCNFCHVRNTETNKMDFASDAKPEKKMAREMYKMTSKINQKYFNAHKDSLGMVMFTGVSCITCHHGTSHPEGGMDDDDK